MPKKNLVHAWKENPQVEECSVPELLRITLLVLRLLSAAPARLRRVGSGWRLAVPPSRLENVRFLFAIVLGVFVLFSTILDFMEKNPNRRLNPHTAALTTFISFTDQTLVLLCHVISEQHLVEKMISLLTTFRHLEKMNISLKGGWYSIRYQKIKVSLLVSFIAWSFMSVANHVYWSIYMHGNSITITNPALYTIVVHGYVFMICTINQLWWGVTIAEISYTITALNSQIRQLLHPSSENNPFITITQINWCVYHMLSVVIIVEPCHWAQDQMEHTHDLLIRLARQTGQRHGRMLTELNLFILQVQMSDL
ncbi:uncharacterized protein [Choristoneura fumiferana]|uniref:uncharacterized protein n=1 Tax=Choristoneura fumiferana TaxID=7141 RepID=UPI003D154284